MFKTMKDVFPQVYLFGTRETRNIVIVAVKSGQPLTMTQLQQRATALVQAGRVRLPTFRTRLQALQLNPSLNLRDAVVLTDDFAPVDGILTRARN
jgi:hypothetical protein